MSDMVIPDDLAARLEEYARRENRTVVEVLKTMVEDYTPHQPVQPPTPEDEAKKREAVRGVMLRTYARARRYWEQVGNQERLALTDEQLDEQFWLIDPEGIPRLKSEQGTIELPPDPLVMIAEAAEKAGLTSEYTNLSENADEFMRKNWPEHLMRKWQRNADESSSD